MSDMSGNLLENLEFAYSTDPLPDLEWIGEGRISLYAERVGDYAMVELTNYIKNASDFYIGLYNYRGVTYEIVDGSLPQGLSLSEYSGYISGTVSAPCDPGPGQKGRLCRPQKPDPRQPVLPGEAGLGPGPGLKGHLQSLGKAGLEFPPPCPRPSRRASPVCPSPSPAGPSPRRILSPGVIRVCQASGREFAGITRRNSRSKWLRPWVVVSRSVYS